MLFDRRGGWHLNPASNQKIMTAHAAVELLGRGLPFRDHDCSRQRRHPRFIRGEGDPSLSVAALDGMLRVAKAKGELAGGPQAAQSTTQRLRRRSASPRASTSTRARTPTWPRPVPLSTDLQHRRADRATRRDHQGAARGARALSRRARPWSWSTRPAPVTVSIEDPK